MKRAHSVFLVFLFIASLSISITPLIEMTEDLSLLRDDIQSSTREELGLNEEQITKTAQDMMMSIFQENLGQVDNEEVLFYGRFPGGMIGFGVDKVLLWLEGTTNCIMMSFVEAAEVIPTKQGATNSKSNYFLGNRGTYTDVSSFRKIRYENLWPGIDLEYKATAKGAKYHFLVAAGSDPSQIRIQYSGQDRLVANPESVSVEIQDKTFTDDGLVVTQGTQEIHANFDMISDSMICFNIGDYDPSKELVIDPLLSSTYIGGSNDDTGYAIQVDSQGYVYVSGHTYSSNFPTQDAYDSTYNSGLYDAFLLKYDPDGAAIIFSTFIGGSDRERGQRMYIEPDGNILISGWTSSTNFPTTGAYDSTHNGGGADVFLVRFNSAGNQLLNSTYIGGNGDDLGGQIHIDESGNVIVTGSTSSSNFPTLNGYDLTHNGAREAFALKISPTFETLIFSTYLGGSNEEYEYGSAVDSDGNIYITGRTWSSNFPTINAEDDTLNGVTDIFVCKLNASGNELIYSTYLGGGGDEYLGRGGIALDDYLYVGGCTTSSDFPVLNAYDNTYNGGWDAFVTKFNITDGTRIASTFVGGSGDETVYGVDVDKWGNTYLTGPTTSSNLPVVNAFSNTSSGGEDGFLFKVNSTCNGLKYSSYYGGSSNDGPRELRLDQTGNVYITGWTASSNFPLVNAYDASLSGAMDMYLMVFSTPSDADFDGLDDDLENALGTDPFSNDSDSDLMPDGWEYYNGLNPLLNDSADDLDFDTLSNLDEFLIGTLPNTNDTDSDMMLDAWEYHNGLKPNVDDADGDLDVDGLTNLQEFVIGSNPGNSDSDYDLMPDMWEYTYGFNLTHDDAGDDFDSDGLSNLDEYLNGCLPNNGDTDSDELGDLEEVEVYGTNPVEADSDNDLLEDGYEVHILGSNPLSTDTDSDQLSDGFEVLQFGTDPTLEDTDGDSMTDYEEYLAGTDPLVADADADADGDGLTNKEEWEAGTDIFDADSDNDGISDLYDPTPLRYDMPMPSGEMAMIGAIIAGSIFPALVVVLLNERMFRRMSGISKRNPEDEVTQEGEK
ncbi:MAG: SBBP repeat-containing protein [Candidatus Thorarchaeota archaeon]